MLNLLNMDNDQLGTLIEQSSLETGLPHAIIEKDFWVCYLLDYLFNRSSFRNSLIFKGGTSLSKAYGLIERFSEDIDLILDWRLLGYGIDEPWEQRSNTKQNTFTRETIGRTNAFLSQTFIPEIKTGIERELAIDVDIRMSTAEETVLFAYPKLFSHEATLDIIRLEIGPLAAWTPSEPTTITSYIAELYPHLFEQASCNCITALPERTFWEKATILHQEANRPGDKAMPRRYARHYYDMFKLGHSSVLNKALVQAELLSHVVAFKEKFYRTPWAHLSSATIGTIKLAPQTSRLQELESDYTAMQAMIFGNAPSFLEIVSYMAELQDMINSTARQR